MVVLFHFTALSQQATINIDLKKEIGDMKPIWAWFGYDEPNYTYMKDGKKLLSEIAALSPVPVFVRAHNLFTTGDGTPALKWGSTNAYTEDANGNPIYNWKIVDSIFDTYIQRGMKPLAQIGFMPEAYHPNRNHINITGDRVHHIKKYSPAGLIHRMIIINGGSLFINGQNIVWSVMEKRKWKAGGGKFGMNLTLVTGREQLKSIVKCMIMQPMVY